LIFDGVIERPDVAIFADTQQEPEHVYRAVLEDQELSLSNGLDFRAITWKDLGAPTIKSIYTPLFTKNAEGKKGQLLRTCTDRFKIRPIHRELRSMGATKAAMWLGISTDEIRRVKPSPLQWVGMRWPLIESNWSRANCIKYLEDHNIEAVRSACVFCPYKKPSEYEYLTPGDIQKAVVYDDLIRDMRPGFTSYVSPTRLPLRETLNIIDITAGIDYEEDECSGICFT